jgi:lipooligosaccharide transport system ATP-binding protein
MWSILVSQHQQYTEGNVNKTFRPHGPAENSDLPAAVLARDLRKSYGDFEALGGISFDVAAGECFGLLGPNGAGKTTTMSILRCVSPLSGGILKVLGLDVTRRDREVRFRLGVVPQHDSLDTDLSCRDNLVIYASYFGIHRDEACRRADQLISFMALEDKADIRIDKLSGGMRRRLLIARGLINNPELLILDEPTTGLDPQARHHIWQRLRSLKNSGTTMLLCTHYMEEAEQLCDRLAIIDHGRILDHGEPADLIRRHAGKEVLTLLDVSRLPDERQQALLQQSQELGIRVERHEDTLFCFTAEASFTSAFLNDIHQLGLPLAVRHATLEDVFLNLTGRDLRE